MQANFEVLDSETASGLKKIKRRVFLQEEGAQKDERFLTWKASRMDDPWVFEGQRHRRIRVGQQWNFEGRIEE